LGRGTLVHDRKSRERSTRALRSRMTTAVVLLAVEEAKVIGGLSLSLCVVSNRPDKSVFLMETSDLRRELRVA